MVISGFPSRAPSSNPVELSVCELDNRLEELQGKYSQEVDERKRLETELKVLQVKVSTTDDICSLLSFVRCAVCTMLQPSL